MNNVIKSFMGVILVMIIGTVLASCASSPGPTVNRTVVFIERVKSGLISGGDMEIFIDGKNAEDHNRKKITLKNGTSVAIPVNNGEHLVHVKLGSSQSEAIKIVTSGETINLYAHQTTPYLPIVGAKMKLAFTNIEKTVPSLPSDVVAGPNETEIVVQYYSQALSNLTELLNIFIDGELAAQAYPDSTERIIVKNGTHAIILREAGKTGLDTPTEFNANSEKIIFNVVKIAGILGISDQTPGKASQ